MEYLDIVDCNAGDHGKAFATNFNPEINIREITQNGRYWQDGKWVTTGPLEIHGSLTYPRIGARESYLLYHEELESLVQNYPTIKRARFWMTFGQEYLTHEVSADDLFPGKSVGGELLKERIRIEFLDIVMERRVAAGTYTGREVRHSGSRDQ